MSKICIIYTGGTIGMVPTDHGYAPKQGYFPEALKEIPELTAPGMPEWDIIEFNPLLDSSNITLTQWNQMGRTIWDHYEEYDGFVILHGTDTMAYSASALSFMLENLDKPVVFTGSQIPLCMLRSDARDNLVSSMLIAGGGVVREVCLYFGARLIRGNRAVKASADGLIAFESPNYPHLADAGIDIHYHKSSLYHPEIIGPFRLQEFSPSSIGVIKVFPGIQFSLFAPIVTEKLNGLVLETFGAGNIPDYGSDLLPMIQRAFENGTIVVVCSQCAQGTVHLGAYETSSQLVAAGAVSGSNMTTEAAIAKLYYLFSLGLSRDDIKEMMERDLRGEMREE